MSTAKHTLGPWEIYGDDDRTTVEIRDSRGIGIAEVGDCSMEDQANARLIAAAPEMLELLQRFERFSAGTGFVYPLGSLHDLRALIAKATGGDQ